MSAMRPALAILMAEIERLDPNSHVNPAVKQVRDLLALAAAGDDGIIRGLNEIASLPRKPARAKPSRPRRPR